jgi:hypothetical protein
MHKFSLEVCMQEGLLNVDYKPHHNMLNALISSGVTHEHFSFFRGGLRATSFRGT